MSRIAIICTSFIVLLLAIVGSLYIFDVMNFEKSSSTMLKFGAAIVLLGVCAALISALMGSKKEPQD